MSTVLTLGAAKMAQGSVVRLPCDWGNLPPLIESYLNDLGYTISTYDVTCPGVGAPAVSAKQVDYTLDGVAYQTSALFTADDAGSFDVVYTITLDDPDATTYEAVGTLEVLET